MKKIIFLLAFVLFTSSMFTGCMSALWGLKSIYFSERTDNSSKHTTDFSYSNSVNRATEKSTPASNNSNNNQSNLNGFRAADCNPSLGYEHFVWGTSYEIIKEQTVWNLSKTTNNCYSMAEHGSQAFYVDKTRLYFNDNCLYAAEDEFNKTPAINILHSRYGKFSEENVVTTQQKGKGIVTVYKGQNYFCDFYGLEIFIYGDGRTIVRLCDPLLEKNNSEKNVPNTWICYLVNDTSNKRINFTFLNKNSDGIYLLVGYSKSLENPGFSYVRSGICWGDNVSGTYDIKGDNGVLSKNYSTDKWKCLYNDEEYTYTNNATESARAIIELFLASQKVMVRHNNLVSEFACNGQQLLDKMAEYGITWEEIDNAMANEEF